MKKTTGTNVTRVKKKRPSDPSTNWKAKPGKLADKIKMAPRNHDEDDEQAAFFEWLSIAMPNVRKVTFAIPNGGKRDAREAARLKKQGVTAGVPDIFCAVPVGFKFQMLDKGWMQFVYGGLFIEMKRKDKKGKPSVLQMEKINHLTSSGYKCVIAHGWEDAKEKIEHYLFAEPTYEEIEKTKEAIYESDNNFEEEFDWKKRMSDG